MGLFSKRGTAKPTVVTQGLRIEYDRDIDLWRFNDNGVAFVACGSACTVPSLSQIADIRADIAALRPEMLRRLEKSCKEWPGVKTNDGETLLVNITNLQSQSSFDVVWCGGASWGNIAIDFTIKNHEITAESWSD
jgi:hypothetical protein